MLVHPEEEVEIVDETILKWWIVSWQKAKGQFRCTKVNLRRYNKTEMRHTLANY